MTPEYSSPPYTFTQDGDRFILRDPDLVDRADYDLWNQTTSLQIDHRGRAAGGFMQPNMTAYGEGLRCFYIQDRDAGGLWSAPYAPIQAKVDHFEFRPGISDIQWTVVKEGLRVDLAVCIPVEDTVECWSVTLTNDSQKTRTIGLYPFFPIGALDPKLALAGKFDPGLNGIVIRHFPYYVAVQDYYHIRQRKNIICCLVDQAPDSWDASAESFLGNGGALHDPASLKRPELSRHAASHNRACAAFQYNLELQPGETFQLQMVFGAADSMDCVSTYQQKYIASPHGYADTVRAVAAFHHAYPPPVRIETPDTDFDHFINHWLPNRVLLIGRTLRFNMAPQGRNAIQDAMAASLMDPQTARQWFIKIWAHQSPDGWMPHGMPMEKGVEPIAITRIPHRDTNVWGPLALDLYLKETGDYAILDEVIPFCQDDPYALHTGRNPDWPDSAATLFEHICHGIDWLLNDRTLRGLSRIGQGDWNDPLNMAGPEDRGESTWLAEALAYALEVWAVVARELKQDTERAGRYLAEAQACRNAINAYCWDGEWYARGTTDNGRLFGSQQDSEGRVFLNAQSWAIISGAANAQRISGLIQLVNQELWSPCGPLVLNPPFTAMQEDIGKLCIKTPGTNENGSVYCHAVTFYAYGLLMAGFADEAWRNLRALLPGNETNTIERAGQLPLYIPNMYRGTAHPEVAGQSSHSPNTGTSAWYYLTVVTQLIGLRAEFNGLRIEPRLPSDWSSVKAYRRFRGAEYHIAITRSSEVETVQITIDGELIEGTLAPFPEPGSVHQVEVRIPVAPKPVV